MSSRIEQVKGASEIAIAHQMRRIEGDATQGSIERKGVQPIDIKRFVPQFHRGDELRDKRIFINALETRVAGGHFLTQAALSFLLG